MAEDKPSQDKTEQPKIVVDSDWKEQARAEKERLAAQQAKADPQAPGPRAAGAPGDMRGLPPANFVTLVSTIASQALFALGAMPDPQTQKRYVNLELAKHQVDTLKVLEEKTKGNLTDEEKALLDRTLYEAAHRLRPDGPASGQRPHVGGPWIAGAQGRGGGGS